MEKQAFRFFKFLQLDVLLREYNWNVRNSSGKGNCESAEYIVLGHACFENILITPRKMKTKGSNRCPAMRIRSAMITFLEKNVA